MTAPRALIAEDEPLLAAALEQELARAWPELAIAVRVGDGLSAVRQALALLPDILFLDIRMPGCSGLEAALELADAWPQGQPLPALVFVTAYDQYAVQAFEAQAVDYLLKPVQPERLRKTVDRLRQALAQRGTAWAQEQTLAQLRQLAQAPGLDRPPTAAPLTLLQASRGNQIHMVALAEVLPRYDHVYFTRYANNPRGVPVEELTAIANAIGAAHHSEHASLADAWQTARGAANPATLITVTGSFFIAAEMRELLGLA